jgi:hypothetical protein
MLIKKGDFTKAGIICNKYLSKKKSALIEEEFNKIKHHQLSEK